MMARIVRVLALLFWCAPGFLLAQNDAGSNAPAGDELKLLREMIEQQSKQIDVLAQEVARLNLLLEARTPTASGLAASPAESPAPGESSVPKALAVQPAQNSGAPEGKASPSGPVHIVIKGETLTAIARHYRVTVPDLLKVNKIADVRKLQIGQTLALPPDAKVPESPTPSPQP
jgi:LysM repeat protein